jgi:hypothetical protein
LIAAALVAAVAVLGLAGSAAAAPAVDEYNSRLPNASGEANVAQTAPKPQPEELPPAVRQQLQKSPAGSTLANIATADQLGAPPPAHVQIDEDSTDGRGVFASALSTLGDPLGILVLLGLAAIAASIVLIRRSGTGGGSGRSA